MILVVCPNPAIDVVLHVDNLRAGAVHRSGSARRRAGGKGLNVARAIEALGGAALVIGFAGGDNGEELRRRAADDGIAFEAVPVKGSTRACYIAIDPASARQTVINECGPTVTDAESAELLGRAVSALGSAAAVVLTGSLPPGVDPGLYGSLCAAARSSGIPVLVDASGAPLRACLSVGVDLVKINAAEARWSTGETQSGINGARRAARALVRLGAREALVTVGARGAVLVDREIRTLCARAPVVESRNAVGAGDAAMAGAAIATADGAPPEELLVSVVAAGTAGAIDGFGDVLLSDYERLRSLIELDTPT